MQRLFVIGFLILMTGLVITCAIVFDKPMPQPKQTVQIKQSETEFLEFNHGTWGEFKIYHDKVRDFCYTYVHGGVTIVDQEVCENLFY